MLKRNLNSQAEVYNLDRFEILDVVNYYITRLKVAMNKVKAVDVLHT